MVNNWGVKQMQKIYGIAYRTSENFNLIDDFSEQKQTMVDFNRISPNTLSQGLKALTSVFKFVKEMNFFN